MRRVCLFAGCCLIAFLGLLSVGCEHLDSDLAMSAASDVIRAATITDQQILELSDQAKQDLDSRHKLLGVDTTHGQRLARLMAPHQNFKQLRLDARVYQSDTPNAFAMANGTIRVHSSLMDLMADEELLFVIGHEIGHIELGHSLRKAQYAYSISAVRKGVGAVAGPLGEVVRGQIGALSEAMIGARFSRDEERSADDFGYRFLVEQGYSPQAGVTALEKLGGGQSGLARLLSSHPDPKARADRLRGRLP